MEEKRTTMQNTVRFDGSFYKSKGYNAYDEALRQKKTVDFDTQRYELICQDIIDTLEDKETYTILEVMSYFKVKYDAFQVPWVCVKDFENPMKVVWDFNEFNTYSDEELKPFDFTGNEDLSTVCLIIDSVFNWKLRREYPSIHDEEMLCLKKLAVDASVNENDPAYFGMKRNYHIAIGSFDMIHYDAMSTNCDRAIPDIAYELYYFSQHC